MSDERTPQYFNGVRVHMDGEMLSQREAILQLRGGKTLHPLLEGVFSGTGDSNSLSDRSNNPEFTAITPQLPL
ncbi:hypothetical protein TNCV_2199451 [Trichonephila clavipes]|nr:hypothetical protein TNCV_2199451 [Trichonephila clavipes]